MYLWRSATRTAAKDLGKITAKAEWEAAVQAAKKTASHELSSAASGATHEAVSAGSRALEAEARAAAKESADLAIQSARVGAAPARIDAYFRGATKLVLATGTVTLGGIGIWRMEQTARDAGDKAVQMGSDFAHAMHEDMDAAIQALAHVPQRLTDGLNVSGPIKTLIQTGTAAVMIGGAVFTVYGTYRLFR